MKKEQPYFPTGSLKTYLPLYRELYKKYKEKEKDELETTEGYKRLNSGKTISSLIGSDFEYFLIQEGHKAIIEMLNRPILESAKYSEGNKVLFIKESWTPQDATIENHRKKTKKDVECTGIITRIFASHAGSGEILYDVKDVVPACWESNPYASEKKIIKLL